MSTTFARREGFSPMMASNQWANRPDDERFESTAELKAHLQAEQRWQRDVSVDMETLRWGVGGSGAPMLTGKAESASAVGAELTHWAFGQWCGMSGMPTGYLRSIRDRKLLLDNLTYGTQRLVEENPKGELQKRFLVRIAPDGNMVRAINGQGFGRIFDLDMIDRIEEMEEMGWRVPPARPVNGQSKGIRKATEEDVLRNQNFALSIRVGDDIAPAGTYYGDRSSFYIRVDEGTSIEVGGQHLFRMVIIQNSEVGAGYWQAYLAYIVGICGNHILHGVQDLKSLQIRHVGEARTKADVAFRPSVMMRVAKDTRLADEGLFRRAKAKEIGPGKAEVVETLFGKRIAPKRTLEAAWLAAEKHEGWYGKPNTVWGMMSGLTEVSQESRWQDKRMEIDEAAAKVMRMA